MVSKLRIFKRTAGAYDYGLWVGVAYRFGAVFHAFAHVHR
eukprot:COSAG04_NODE_14009_length_584_cov_0.552577_1_plen_39_part_01